MGSTSRPDQHVSYLLKGADFLSKIRIGLFVTMTRFRNEKMRELAGSTEVAEHWQYLVRSPRAPTASCLSSSNITLSLFTPKVRE